jgi:hypothetical protein
MASSRRLNESQEQLNAVRSDILCAFIMLSTFNHAWCYRWSVADVYAEQGSLQWCRGLLCCCSRGMFVCTIVFHPLIGHKN